MKWPKSWLKDLEHAAHLVRRGCIHDRPPGYVPDLTEAINYYTPDARPGVEKPRSRGLRQVGRGIWNGYDHCQGPPHLGTGPGNGRMEEGKAKRLFGTFQDITDRKQATIALEANERALQSLTETMATTPATWTKKSRPSCG